MSQKRCYSKIGICNVFVQFEATFTDTQSSWSAPGLHLKTPLLMNNYTTKNNIAGLIYLPS